MINLDPSFTASIQHPFHKLALIWGKSMRDCVIHLAKISFVIVTMISSGCQLVQLRENQLSQSLDDKMTSILTSQYLFGNGEHYLLDEF